MKNSYDIVIIGSGLGGLECGLMLSKEGYKVCVLEQARVFGGCLQSFYRKGRCIDTGIHYVGSMSEGQIMRQYLKYFDIFNDLEITPLDEDFDVISFGDKEFNYKHGHDQFLSYLTQIFPSEKEGLKRYLDKIKEIGTSIGTDVHKSGNFSSGDIYNLGVSAADFIDDCVENKVLRDILAGTNVLYGGERNASNLYHHAMINNSNIEGAYRFIGGTQKIADLMVKKIESHGGVVRNCSKVVHIDVEQADVKSVELENGEKIFGKHFISDIHPASTFNMLGNTPVIKKAYRSRLNLLSNTYGIFSVYLMMKPNSFPYLNQNHYFYKNQDAWDTVIEKNSFDPKAVLLSTQLGKKGDKFSDIVVLMTAIQGNYFERWINTRVGKRGDDYNEIVNQLSSQVIDYSARFCPQIKDHIEDIYTATPLTYLNYTGTPQGSAYGLLKDYNKMMSTLLPARTKLNNLFLTGQNLNVHGALGVTITAATTCAELLGKEYLAKKIGKA